MKLIKFILRFTFISTLAYLFGVLVGRIILYFM